MQAVEVIRTAEVGLETDSLLKCPFEAITFEGAYARMDYNSFKVRIPMSTSNIDFLGVKLGADGKLTPLTSVGYAKYLSIEHVGIRGPMISDSVDECTIAEFLASLFRFDTSPYLASERIIEVVRGNPELDPMNAVRSMFDSTKTTGCTVEDVLRGTYLGSVDYSAMLEFGFSVLAAVALWKRRQDRVDIASDLFHLDGDLKQDGVEREIRILPKPGAMIRIPLSYMRRDGEHSSADLLLEFIE